MSPPRRDDDSEHDRVHPIRPPEGAGLQAQIEYLAQVITDMEESMPTPGDMAYIRSRRLADERASWAWQTIKVYAPWVTVIGSALGSVAYWVLTHTITIGKPP